MAPRNKDEESMHSVDREDGEAEDMEDLARLEQRIREMEVEADKLRVLHHKVVAEKEVNRGSTLDEGRETVDARSVYVGNVDWAVVPEDLQKHFQSCGVINRITILCDKWTHQPKGYAYVEFADASSVMRALVLNESMFYGRTIKVTPKRTNIPGMAQPARERSSRGRGGFRGGLGGGGGGMARPAPPHGLRPGGYGSPAHVVPPPQPPAHVVPLPQPHAFHPAPVGYIQYPGQLYPDYHTGLYSGPQIFHVSQPPPPTYPMPIQSGGYHGRGGPMMRGRAGRGRPYLPY